MVRKFNAVLFSNLIVGLTLLSSCSKAQLVERSCGIYKDVVGIAFSPVSNVGGKNEGSSSIDFQEKGITMRFPPEPYALPWENVDRISFNYSYDGDDAELLHVQIRSLGTIQDDPIGIVQRTCWNAVKKYIASAKIKVPISEVQAVPLPIPPQTLQ